jgi:hypothetical protein
LLILQVTSKVIQFYLLFTSQQVFVNIPLKVYIVIDAQSVRSNSRNCHKDDKSVLVLFIHRI